MVLLLMIMTSTQAFSLFNMSQKIHYNNQPGPFYRNYNSQMQQISIPNWSLHQDPSCFTLQQLL